MSAWTWETLTGADRRSLEELMRTGATPDIDQLLGHTYRGLNRGLVPRITGRKFKKVFHEHEGRPFGHNIVDRHGKPVEIGWFSVRPEGRMVRFDYNVKENSGSTCPYEASRTSWCSRTPATTRWCYFVLQRETV